MNKTDITHEITDEEYDRMVLGIKTLDSQLGFTVNLTKEQSRKLQKMGDKSFAFLSKTMSYATDRPDLIPPCSDMVDFKRDYELTNKLRQLLEMAGPVIQKMRDSYFLVGAQAFLAARKYYGYVKAAAVAGAPGSTAICLDLGKRYARIKTSDKETDSNPVTTKSPVQEYPQK
jgi:hypothetical protein